MPARNADSSAPERGRWHNDRMSTQKTVRWLPFDPDRISLATIGRISLGSSLVAIGLAGSLAGCESSTRGEGGPTSIVIVGQQPDDDRVQMVTEDALRGETVVVEVPGNAGTGYTWSMTAHSEGVQLLGTPSTKPLEEGLPGGQNLTTFKLKLTESGRQTARLELARTWEANTPAARVVNLVINVAGEAE